MRWFKHYTDAISDPFIEELMDKYSHSGYVAWFGLIEIICKENGNELTGNLEISPAYLKRKLRISQTKLRQIFDFCATNGKLLFDYSEEKWKFTFPKIAEIKDNYTKDLQVTGKKPSNHKEVEVEVEVEKKKKNKTFPSDSDEIRLVDYFIARIKTNKPDSREPNKQTWAKTFDLIIRKDGKKPKEIAGLIKWCQNDSFEMVNVLSPDKLRSRWDNLSMKKNRAENVKPEEAQSMFVGSAK